MPTKQTPKSCSCYSCRRGKGSSFGHCIRNVMEKSLRRVSKLLIKQGRDEDVSISPKGNYFD